MAMVPASSVLGESTHDRISPDGLMLRKPELEQRESREYRKFRSLFASCASLKKNQNAPRPFRLLGACAAGGQSNVFANSAKNAMCLVWVRDDSKHRQNDRTVLYYSRLYYTRLCCCNLSFHAKNRDSATMAMVPLCMMVHSQVAVLLPGGEAHAIY